MGKINFNNLDINRLNFVILSVRAQSRTIRNSKKVSTALDQTVSYKTNKKSMS